jgi:hypothetical protein
MKGNRRASVETWFKTVRDDNGDSATGEGK